MFGSFGWMELMLILIIVLIIFGAGKLPQLGEGLGKAIKGFKKSVHEAEAIEASGEEEPGTPPGEPSGARSAPPPSVAEGPGGVPASEAPERQPEGARRG